MTDSTHLAPFCTRLPRRKVEH